MAAAGSEELWDGLGVWLQVPSFGGHSLSQAEVLLEAEWVALQGSLGVKDRNIFTL